MEITAWLAIGIFLAVMIPTILISALPRVTIALLQRTGLYTPGSLHFDKRHYVNGAGQHVYRGVYLTYRNGSEHFENMRVYLYTQALAIIPAAVIITIAYVIWR